MEFSINAGSFPATILVLFVLTILPVKIGATVFGAENNDFKSCFISVFLGTTAALLCGILIGGFLGFLSAYIAVSYIYSKFLKLSFTWSFLFTIGILIIQIGIMQAIATFIS